MARGYIFETVYSGEEEKKLGLIGEENFYDGSGVAWDFVQDASKEAAEKEKGGLIKMLQGFGAEVTDSETAGDEVMMELDGNGCDIPVNTTGVILTDEVKERYFQGKFDRMKELVASITLKEFATGAAEVFLLKQAVEDSYGNCVYHERDGLTTFDDWMREAPTGIPIYFGNVIFMH